MTTEQVQDLADDVRQALGTLKEVMQERDFLRRVLKQAVLTHGGTLTVDPSLSEAAENDRRCLMCATGTVRLE